MAKKRGISKLEDDLNTYYTSLLNNKFLEIATYSKNQSKLLYMEHVIYLC